MAQDIKKQETSGSSVQRYWDPFAQMRREMDRVFDSFLGREPVGWPSLSRMTTSEAVTPDVDVHETDKDIVFEVELPGMNEKDINVTVRNGVLSLTGEKKSERDEKKDTYHLVERSYGAFQRSFRLPDAIEEDQIRADFDKGVLRIVVPKHAEAVKAEKKIPIGKV
jgi:HSP20 family protein